MMSIKIFAAAVSLVGGCSLVPGANASDPGDRFADPNVAHLIETACNGRASEVERIIAAGVDPNAIGDGGMTPLLSVISCDNEIGFIALLDNGANPNEVSAERYNPAIVAARADNPKFLDILIRRGADIYAVPAASSFNAVGTAFYSGAFHDNWAPYELLLANQVDVNRFVDNRELIDLADFAMTTRRYDRVRELLDAGYVRDLEMLAAHVDARAANLSPEQEVARDSVRRRIAEIRQSNE